MAKRPSILARLLRLPEDWWDAIDRTASQKGMSSAEWVRRRLRSGIPVEDRGKLSEPPKIGRPKKPAAAPKPASETSETLTTEPVPDSAPTPEPPSSPSA